MSTQFSENAITVLEKRYLMQDEEGRILETPDALLRRVADGVAEAESAFGKSKEEISQLADNYFQAMSEHKFLPNSPTLMNAGKPGGQLSACFVLPVPDNLEGIFETCKNAALIHKTGGGTGFSFSRLRPIHDRVSSTVGVASGPVSFMTVYDAATEAIRQGGTRRGANMGILRIDHPDIEQFISCKANQDKLNNFNISVAVTDQFMQAVKQDKEFALVHPSNKKICRTVKARELFQKIAENAHLSGEPGLVFIDRINQTDPLIQTVGIDSLIVPGTEDIEATNPCGEQPLGPGDACNLGSINVAKFVDTNSRDFDWQKLKEMIELAVRFLDDVVEANHYPMDFIDKAARNNRRIGVGIMGLAEALILLSIRYDSDEALVKAEELAKFLQKHTHEASSKLAQERGNFPNWSFSTWGKNDIPMRNATTTAIAPTGTISIIAGTSSGIEPLFAVSFVRRVLGGIELVDVNPLFERFAKEQGFYSERLMVEIAEKGTIQEVVGVPQSVKQLFICAHDIDYIWHLKMQAAFQKYTDSGVSKTINFPSQATTEDVLKTYLEAYELGLKGITVYRDKSRQSQVLNITKPDGQHLPARRFCTPCGDMEPEG
jgi:ribonucleoside-diphosphate reductase alpha chain